MHYLKKSKCIKKSEESKQSSTQVMLYSTQAEMMKLSSNPTAAAIEIKALRAGGSTNFVAVFQKIRTLLQVCEIKKYPSFNLTYLLFNGFSNFI